MLYALYDESQAEASIPTRLHLPAKVAVAQIGEVAPSQQMVDLLRKEAGLLMVDSETES